MVFNVTKRSFLLITANSKLGYFKNQDEETVMKHGNVIRTGDVVKLGTTLLLIKESSIDIKKIKDKK